MLLGKWMAIEAAVQSPLVLVLVVVGSALTVFFWAKWLGRITTASYHETYTVEQAPRGMTATLLFLAALVIGSMVGALPLYHLWARPVVSTAPTQTTTARIAMNSSARVVGMSLE